jgi:uncharacterized membrane protein YgdD (TMEM256/DUF423 family)
MNKTIVVTAGIMGLIGIIFGAMGAHALKNQIESDALASFQTGVQYQMYHALFLLALGGVITMAPKQQNQIFWLIVSGVCCFSGSIYVLSTASITGIDFKSFGWITPLGGLLLIVGWIMFIKHTLSHRISR